MKLSVKYTCNHMHLKKYAIVLIAILKSKPRTRCPSFLLYKF